MTFSHILCSKNELRTLQWDHDKNTQSYKNTFKKQKQKQFHAWMFLHNPNTIHLHNIQVYDQDKASLIHANTSNWHCSYLSFPLCNIVMGDYINYPNQCALLFTVLQCNRVLLMNSILLMRVRYFFSNIIDINDFAWWNFTFLLNT